MHSFIRSLYRKVGILLSIIMLLTVLSGCSSKDAILKPYEPMGATPEANSDISPTVAKEAIKRLDGISGNTLLIKPDSEFDSSRISAGQALLVNITSGEVLLSKQSMSAIPAGNFTKIFAACVVLQNEVNPEQTISISQDTYNLSNDLVLCKFQKDDVYTVQDLLYASLMYCANDAVIALSASRPGGSISSFLKEMNALSESKNLKSTWFSNVYGYPSGGAKQETTLLDVFSVVRDLIETHPEFIEIIGKPVYFCTYMNSKNEPASASWSSSLPYFNTEEAVELPEQLILVGGICEPASSNPTQIFCLFKDVYGTQYIALLAGCSSYEDCFEQMQSLVTYIPGIY
ncbi:MAG: D-alanyl-D-alanine carboxypeptidase [Lachnospiraceae bacterium]|nr:D-alanyl-D-alanine carboxypeptidase [Lachnospiraceae bacterium]